MLALLVAAALMPASPACHASGVRSVVANLDGDRAKEHVQARDAHNCSHTHFAASVVIFDRCRGAWTEVPVAEEQSRLRYFQVLDVDRWTRRREVFFFIGDKVRIVRLAARRGECPQPVDLFSATGVSSVDLADLTPRYRGLELQVTANGETTFHRYARTQRRYVPYTA
jgi:hypothetical protein